VLVDEGEASDLLLDTAGGEALARTADRAGRIVTIAAEAPGADYFVVEPDGAQLASLPQLVPEVDSVFELEDFRGWVWAVGLGAVFAGVMAFMAIRTEDATARPDGLELVGAVLWRGVVYGAVDGLLLSVFPILVVFAAFAGSRLNDRFAGKLAIGVAALMASLAMTAVYHFGYSDFRSDKVTKPLTGDVVWSVPTLLTLNAVGAPIAHAGLHVSAVLHSYDTDTFLPPHN
jgi:hypothetical protein